jgi:hypothetical protein
MVNCEADAVATVAEVKLYPAVVAPMMVTTSFATRLLLQVYVMVVPEPEMAVAENVVCGGRTARVAVTVALPKVFQLPTPPRKVLSWFDSMIFGESVISVLYPVVASMAVSAPSFVPR